jgi:hypothetical protein
MMKRRFLKWCEKDGSARVFEVVGASQVSDARKHIATEEFAILLSGPHVPLAGDGSPLIRAG